MVTGADESPLDLPEPEISVEQVAELLAVLAKGPADPEAKGWMTAAEIAPQIPDTTEREVRKIASAACPQVVSFPGSRGYKLWQDCSVEEIAHCIEAFKSQARDMLKRAVVYRQAYHRRFRGAPRS